MSRRIRTGKAWRKGLIGGATSIFLCSSAEAHLVTTGLGPVYDGMSHMLLTPEDLLPILALTLYAGLRGAPYSRSVLFLLPAAWLIGGLIGISLNVTINPALATISLLFFGGLVASDARLPRPVVSALAAALGLFHGFLNGAAMEEADLGVLGLVGIVATAFVMVSLIASFVVPLQVNWLRIAVRVLGSWIAAIGLLMLGWAVGSQG